MTSSYGATTSQHGQMLTPEFSVAVDGLGDFDVEVIRDVTVRMAVPNRSMWHFVDDGEEVELYVTFAEGVEGVRPTNGDGRVDDELVYKVTCAVYFMYELVVLFVT
jgi:hypothetical protein